jgi:predicted phage baseplate assembly protein
MSEHCDCCTTDGPQLPLPTVNRPGLTALAYRIGTYATFFEAMKAELAGFGLSGLTTRDSSDPAIVLLDAWAMVADVLTFYQERIANEGLLRTAVERRSVLELATLVGAKLRPGVSASVSLAYTMDQNSVATVPIGSRVQSLPAQDQLPQSFELSDDLQARAEWNNLAPQTTRPQILSKDAPTVYVAGLTTNLKPNDRLLVIASEQEMAIRSIATVEPDAPHSRTTIGLLEPPSPDVRNLAVHRNASADLPRSRLTNFVDLLQRLSTPPAAPLARASDVQRSVPRTFAPESGAVPSTVRLLKPEARSQFFEALRNATVAPQPSGELHAFRVKAAPFGHNAPLKSVTDEKGIVVGTEEWPLTGAVLFSAVLSMATWRGREIGAPLDMIALSSRVEKSLFLQIKLGTEKASRSFDFTTESASLHVGRWRVSTSLNSEVFKLTFEDFHWSCEVTSEERGAALAFRINGGEALIIPIGHTSETVTDGERLRLSTAHGIEIEREAPVAPKPLDVIDLDSTYDQIARDSWVAIDFANGNVPLIRQVKEVQTVSVARYGLTGRVTRLHLNGNWLTSADLMLSAVRPVRVLAQSELLALAPAPVEKDVGGDTIELADFYGDLPAGRRLIVEGERSDVDNTTGVKGAELVTIASVEVLPPDGSPATYPGERIHSQLKLATQLSYRYKPETVVIHGNVASFTHGETKREVLGSGDGSQPTQRFTLRQGPVSHLEADTPSGIRSTLEVRVNGIPWQEVASLTEAGPFDRCYITQVDEADKTTIIFGDGVNGMRLPTGRENVTATYRVGLGSDGNVPAAAINQLATRPFGVKAVASPLAAAGGVDRDVIDQGKSNVARAASAMDRLVSVNDYADFACLFGGIGKAVAIAVPGRRNMVHLTVAGALWTDNPVKQSENLRQALAVAGDSSIFFEVDSCELMLLIVAAQVLVAPDRVWSEVEPDIRSALVDRFGYQRRQLGQSIALSELTAAIQSVSGVAAVHVTALESISASDAGLDSRLKQKLAGIGAGAPPASSIAIASTRIDPATMRPVPAQLAFLSAELPDTLILTELVS